MKDKPGKITRSFEEALECLKNIKMPECGDSACKYSEHLGGMRVNGGCRCYEATAAVSRVILLELIFKYEKEKERAVKWRNRSMAMEEITMREKDKLEKAVEVLKFYANESRYQGESIIDGVEILEIINDSGTLANQTLKELGEEQDGEIEANVPLGKCSRCNASYYTMEGFCGNCCAGSN